MSIPATLTGQRTLEEHDPDLFDLIEKEKHRQWSGLGTQGPARFGHGLGTVKSGRNRDAHTRGALPVTAMPHPKGSAVAAVGGGRAILQDHVGKTGGAHAEEVRRSEKTSEK